MRRFVTISEMAYASASVWLAAMTGLRSGTSMTVARIPTVRVAFILVSTEQSGFKNYAMPFIYFARSASGFVYWTVTSSVILAILDAVDFES